MGLSEEIPIIHGAEELQAHDRRIEAPLKIRIAALEQCLRDSRDILRRVSTMTDDIGYRFGESFDAEDLCGVIDKLL